LTNDKKVDTTGRKWLSTAVVADVLSDEEYNS